MKATGDIDGWSISMILEADRKHESTGPDWTSDVEKAVLE